MHLHLPATAADLRLRAQARLPRFLFDYVDGGATDEQTLRANEADWARVTLRQRVLVDVDGVDTRTTLAGQPCSLPLALAPIGLAGLMARRGEVQAARAAQTVGVPFTLSTVGICPLDEVQRAVVRPTWFQLYMLRDRGIVEALLQRAWAAGCRTLVFTVDLPTSGMRHRDTRNGMLDNSLRGKLGKAWQLGARPGWIVDVGVRGKPHSFGNLADLVPDPTDLKAYRTWIDAQFDTSVTWRDIEWLRGIWKGQLILKGIQEPEDALGAAKIGADGLVVSNHGARQLDSVHSSISKLPGVVAAVGKRLEIYVDGGVRSGLDVFKAVALGARGVMIGRPWAWALAAGGEAAIAGLLATFKKELEVAMALSGVTAIGQICGDQIDPM